MGARQHGRHRNAVVCYGKEKASAALGHAVLDADTGSLLNVRKGEMVEADVLGVTKGSSGFPGELRGAFGAKSLRIGSIDVNTELGIFGIADSADYTCEAGETLPIAFRTKCIREKLIL